MGTLRNSPPGLEFNGGVSIADQFSEPINLANFSTEEAAFMLRVSLAQGPLAITLQTNLDGDVVLSGWQDVSASHLQILDMTNSNFLDQTDASIESGKRRGGIVKGGSVNVDLFFQFTAASANYRLRFQLTSATSAQVEWIQSAP